MPRKSGSKVAVLAFSVAIFSGIAIDFSLAATKKVPVKRAAAVSKPPAVRVARPAKTSLFKITKKRRALVAANGVLILSTFVTLANQWGAASDYEALYASIDGTTDLNQARLFSEKNKVDLRADVVMAVSLVTLASLTYTALVWKDAGRSDPPRVVAPVSLGLSRDGIVLAARMGF